MIHARNIAFTLICPSCDRPMYASDYQRGKDFVIWRCQSMRCDLTGRPFRQTLPQVQLDELEPEKDHGGT